MFRVASAGLYLPVPPRLYPQFDFEKMKEVSMKQAIKRMFGSGLPKLAVLALAALASGGAWAVTKPLAIWNGDFDVASRNGFTIDAQSNTIAADGSKITITAQGTGGVLVSTTVSNYQSLICIAGFKTNDCSLASLPFLMATQVNRTGGADLTGVFLDSTGKFQGSWQKGNGQGSQNQYYPADERVHYFANVFGQSTSYGTKAYLDGSTLVVNDSGLASSFGNTTGMSIGGACSSRELQGAEINYIAVYASTSSQHPSDMADYVNNFSPTAMTDSETISSSGGSVTGGSNVGVNLNGGTVNVTADTTVAALFVQGTTTLSFMGNAKLTVNGPIYIATGSTLKIDVSTMTSASQAYIIANGLISDFSQIELDGEEGGYDYSLFNDGGTIKVTRLPARTFSYIAKSGQSPSGWFSSFNNTYGDNFTASAMRIGPDGDFVYETTSAAKPYADLSGRTTFTFSIYADISQMDADRKALMVAFGSGGGNNVMLYREGDYVRAGYYNGNTLKCASAVEVAAATTLGYHLYTIVCEQAESSNTITIYKDGIAGTSSSTSELVSLPTGFQISTTYGGNIPGTFWQGERMAVAAMCGYDVALGSSEVAALTLEYPVTDGKLPVDLNTNMTGVGLTLYESDTAESPHFLGYYNNGTITIPSGASVSVSSIRAANAESGGPATVNIAGDLTVWSTSSSYNAYGSNDYKNYKGILIGHYIPGGTYNITGSLVGENAYMQTGQNYGGGQQTINIDGGTVKVKGLYENSARTNKAIINLTNNGTLELADLSSESQGGAITKNFGLGTFKLYSTLAQTQTKAVNFNGTTGTGTTINPNGQTLTFNAGTVTGNGIITIDTSVVGSKVIFSGVSGFTGTLTIDDSNKDYFEVSDWTGFAGTLNYGVSDVALDVSDIDFSSATVNLSNGATMIAAAGQEGIVNVASGTTLELTVTEDQYRYVGHLFGGTVADGGTLTYTLNDVAVDSASLNGNNLLPYWQIFEVEIVEGEGAGAINTAACWKGNAVPTGRNAAFHVTDGAVLTVTVDTSITFGEIQVYGSGEVRLVRSGASAIIATNGFYITEGVDVEIVDAAATAVTGPDGFVVPAGSSVTYSVTDKDTVYNFTEKVQGAGSLRLDGGVVTFASNALLANLTGGLVVLPDTVAKTASGARDDGVKTGFGPYGARITVYTGGQVDVANTKGVCYDFVVEDGGSATELPVLTNSGEEIGKTQRQAKSLTINADAIIECPSGKNFGLINNGYNGTSLTVKKGVTVTKKGSGDFWLCNTTISASGDSGNVPKLVIEAGRIYTHQTGSAGAALDIEVEDGAAMYLERGIAAHSITVNSGGAINMGGSDGWIDGLTTMTINSGATVNCTGTTKTGTLIYTAGLIVDGTLTLGGKTVSATTVSGTGRVEYTGKLPDSSSWSTGTSSTGWRGTVAISNYSSSGSNPWNASTTYGNANSVVEVSNCYAYYLVKCDTADISPELKLVGTGLKVANGNSGDVARFARLSGSGPLVTENGPRQVYLFGSSTDFSGSITNDGRRIVFGNTWPSNDSNGDCSITIYSGYSASLGDGATWKSNRIWLRGELDVKGAGLLEGAVTLYDGATLKFDDIGTAESPKSLALSSGSLDFSSGTVSISFGADAVLRNGAKLFDWTEAGLSEAPAGEFQISDANAAAKAAYALTKTADGLYLTSGAASVNGTAYATLEEAVSVAGSDVVVLLANNTESIVLAPGTTLKVQKGSFTCNTPTTSGTIAVETSDDTPTAGITTYVAPYASVTTGGNTQTYATQADAYAAFLTAIASDDSATMTYSSTPSYSDAELGALAEDGVYVSGSTFTKAVAVASTTPATSYSSLASAVSAEAVVNGTTVTLKRNSIEAVALSKQITFVEDSSATFTGTFTGSGTLTLTSLLKSAAAGRWPTGEGGWSGTVVLPETIAAIDGNFDFNYYGNGGSTVRVRTISGGWLKSVAISPTVDIETSFSLTDYSASFPNTFAKLTGSGTLSVSCNASSVDVTSAQWNSNYYAYFLVNDVSEFTGSITVNNVGVAIGSSKPAYTTPGGKIIVSSGKTATIASGKTWQAPGGFTVDGVLFCNHGIIYGSGSGGTLALGGSGVLTNSFVGGSAQCFNAGAITVSDSLSVVLLGGWSNFGTWTLNGTSSLGFDPGSDDDIWIYNSATESSPITSAGQNTTVHIYGNGVNKVVDYAQDGTKDAKIHVHNGGTFQVANAAADNDRLKYDDPDKVGGITVDAGGLIVFKSRESYTRNTTLNGGTFTLDGIQSNRSIDIFKGPTFTVTENSLINATGTGHWIYLRNSNPTFNVAEGKTLTVNASFKYDASDSHQDLVKAGAGIMVVNGYVDGGGAHESFSQPKGVTINAGTYELNAVQTSNGQTGDAANFYTVASGAKLKVGATGQVNAATLTLNDGSLLEFGASSTLINATTVSFASGTTTVSFSTGFTPTSGTKLIDWSAAPNGSFNSSVVIGDVTYYLNKKSDGLYVYSAATYNGTDYDTVQAAIDAMTPAGGALSDITVNSADAVIPSGYALVTNTSTGAMTLRGAGGDIYWTSGTSWAEDGDAVFTTASGAVTPYVSGDTVVVTNTTKRSYGPVSNSASLRFDCAGAIDVDRTDSIDCAFTNATIVIATGATVNFVQDSGSNDPVISGCSITGAGGITVATGTTLTLNSSATGGSTVSVPIVLSGLGSSLVVASGSTASVPTTAVEGAFVETSTDGGTTTYTVRTAVAMIGATPYSSLADAVGAASEGATVTLVANSSEDITLDKTIILVESGASFTGTFTGSGTLVMSALPTARWDAGWEGVLWLTNVTISGSNPVDFGNANSTLRLTGCSGTFNDNYIFREAKHVFPGTLDLVDDGDTPAFTVVGGFTNWGKAIFTTLTGTGTIAGTSGGHCYQFYNSSGFHGSIAIASDSSMRVVFGIAGVDQNDVARKSITVQANVAITMASDMTWTAPGGIEIYGSVSAPSAAALSGSLKGDGTVTLASLDGSVLNCSNSWSGTVVLPSAQAFSGFVFDNYGVAGSTVRVQGANTGTLDYKSSHADSVATTVEIPSGASLTVTGWNGSYTNTFNVLKGAGSFAVNVSNPGDSRYFLLKDVSDFTGTLSATGAGIAIGSSKPDSSVPGGRIVVMSGTTTEVPSGKTWTGATGIDVSGALVVSGNAVAGSGDISVFGGGVLEISAAPSQSTSYVFSNGTFRVKADLTVSSANNMTTTFCGTTDNPTVIDPYGHTTTLTAEALRGNGDITVADSSELHNGMVIFPAISGNDFKGYVILTDANAANMNVSAYDGRLRLRGTESTTINKLNGFTGAVTIDQNGTYDARGVDLTHSTVTVGAEYRTPVLWATAGMEGSVIMYTGVCRLYADNDTFLYDGHVFTGSVNEPVGSLIYVHSEDAPAEMDPHDYTAGQDFTAAENAIVRSGWNIAPYYRIFVGAEGGTSGTLATLSHWANNPNVLPVEGNAAIKVTNDNVLVVNVNNTPTFGELQITGIGTVVLDGEGTITVTNGVYVNQRTRLILKGGLTFSGNAGIRLMPAAIPMYEGALRVDVGSEDTPYELPSIDGGGSGLVVIEEGRYADVSRMVIRELQVNGKAICDTPPYFRIVQSLSINGSMFMTNVVDQVSGVNLSGYLVVNVAESGELNIDSSTLVEDAGSIVNNGTINVTGESTLVYPSVTVNGTLNMASTASLAGVEVVAGTTDPVAMSGTGTVRYIGKMPDGTGNTSWWNTGTASTGWRGTLAIKDWDHANTGWTPAKLGSQYSTLEVEDCNVLDFAGSDDTALPTLKLAGNLTINNGGVNRVNKFAGLAGSGTLAIVPVPNVTQTLKFGTGSDFTGSITNANFKLVFGTSAGEASTITVDSGVTAGLGDGATWKSGNIKINGTLDVKGTGTLEGSVAASNGSQVNLATVPLTVNGTFALPEASGTMTVNPGSIDVSDMDGVGVPVIAGITDSASLTAGMILTNVTVYGAADASLVVAKTNEVNTALRDIAVYKRLPVSGGGATDVKVPIKWMKDNASTALAGETTIAGYETVIRDTRSANGCKYIESYALGLTPNDSNSIPAAGMTVNGENFEIFLSNAVVPEGVTLTLSAATKTAGGTYATVTGTDPENPETPVPITNTVDGSGESVSETKVIVPIPTTPGVSNLYQLKVGISGTTP